MGKQKILGILVLILFLIAQAYFIVPIIYRHLFNPLLNKFIEYETTKQLDQLAHETLMDERWLY